MVLSKKNAFLIPLLNSICSDNNFLFPHFCVKGENNNHNMYELNANMDVFFHNISFCLSRIFINVGGEGNAVHSDFSWYFYIFIYIYKSTYYKSFYFADRYKLCPSVLRPKTWQINPRNILNVILFGCITDSSVILLGLYFSFKIFAMKV